MTTILLLTLFAFAVFIFWRLPAVLTTLVAGGAGLVFAIALFFLAQTPAYSGGVSNPHRSDASLVIAAMILVSSLVPLGTAYARPRANKRRPSRETGRAPTLAGVNANNLKGEGNSSLSRYELRDRVGIGGMATVYRALRKDDSKIVALKIPQEKFVADAKFVRRFHREAEVLMRLNHPNIIKVFEHSNEGTTHFISMEFVEGESLESLIETRRLTLEHSTMVLRATADALRYIHKQGIIHRDIKPGNIMVTKSAMGFNPPSIEPNGVKLMDFGIAAGKVLTRLTMTGARVGTPVYMSPEQARGLKIDHRTDIYSLGLVFYEMVTGVTAFKGGYEAVVQAQIFQTPTPPRQVNLEVSQKLNDLVMRMIEKDPEKRASLNEVIEAVDAGLLEGSSSLDGPVQLVVSLNSRKGPLRILDGKGNLERSLSSIGQGADKFPAAPVAVAADRDLNLFAAVFEYRAGESSPKMIRKLDPNGTELSAFGNYGMKPGDFLYPAAISVAPWDQVYVLDSEACMVQRFTLDGQFISKFGGRGAGRGTFDDPRNVIAGSDGFVYVLDFGNRQVQRFNRDGEFIQRFSFKINSESSELRVLDGVGVDATGVLYIADASSSKIRSLIFPAGKQGQSFNIEPLHGEDTNNVMDIGIDQQGFVYAARRGGHIVRKFAPDGTLMVNIETYAPILSFHLFLRDLVKN
jgi:eukaryotic-like serine/threonine-protein kinase